MCVQMSSKLYFVNGPMAPDHYEFVMSVSLISCGMLCQEILCLYIHNLKCFYAADGENHQEFLKNYFTSSEPF